MKTVKYQVESMVGNFAKGDIIDVKLLLEGCDKESIILHEEEDGFCACIEIVKLCSDGIYRQKSEGGWINMTNSFKGFQELK